jgi:hypothetical protein
MLAATDCKCALATVLTGPWSRAITTVTTMVAELATIFAKVASAIALTAVWANATTWAFQALAIVSIDLAIRAIGALECASSTFETTPWMWTPGALAGQ